jgi:hypothetical protein
MCINTCKKIDQKLALSSSTLQTRRTPLDTGLHNFERTRANTVKIETDECVKHIYAECEKEGIPLSPPDKLPMVGYYVILRLESYCGPTVCKAVILRTTPGTGSCIKPVANTSFDLKKREVMTSFFVPKYLSSTEEHALEKTKMELYKKPEPFVKRLVNFDLPPNRVAVQTLSSGQVLILPLRTVGAYSVYSISSEERGMAAQQPQSNYLSASSEASRTPMRGAHGQQINHGNPIYTSPVRFVVQAESVTRKIPKKKESKRLQ